MCFRFKLISHRGLLEWLSSLIKDWRDFEWRLLGWDLRFSPTSAKSPTFGRFYANLSERRAPIVFAPKPDIPAIGYE